MGHIRIMPPRLDTGTAQNGVAGRGNAAFRSNSNGMGDPGNTTLLALFATEPLPAQPLRWLRWCCTHSMPASRPFTSQSSDKLARSEQTSLQRLQASVDLQVLFIGFRSRCCHSLLMMYIVLDGTCVGCECCWYAVILDSSLWDSVTKTAADCIHVLYRPKWYQQDLWVGPGNPFPCAPPFLSDHQPFPSGWAGDRRRTGYLNFHSLTRSCQSADPTETSILLGRTPICVNGP